MVGHRETRPEPDNDKTIIMPRHGSPYGHAASDRPQSTVCFLVCVAWGAVLWTLVALKIVQVVMDSGITKGL